MAVATWAPVRVDLECQGSGRVEACDFVRSALDRLDVVAVVPRAQADVVLYLDVTERQSDDLWLLRATSELSGAPGAFEQVAAVDYRLPVDDQRACFVAPLSRVLAPFVIASVPDAVQVDLAPPVEAEERALHTTPYGAELEVGGFGSWTDQYQSGTLESELGLFRVTPRDGQGLKLGYERVIERQPALEVDGRTVPMTFDAEALQGSVYAHRSLDRRWTVGLLGRAGHEDEDGLFASTVKLHAGLERDWFAPDDPRGNRLSLAWLVGVQDDVYQRRNVLGETAARFPTSMLLLEGDVRFDTVALELDLSAQAELLRPQRRYVLYAAAEAALTLGSHVDLALEAGVTQQAVPGPASLDESDFEQVRRASYAEPLKVDAALTLRVHLDPTNGARNDRFDPAIDLDATDNL